MEIITAGDGTAHVSSADDGAIYAGIVGPECYVTSIGDKLSCTMQSANKALIGTGVGVMYGRMLRVTVPEEVSIASGTQARRRNDIICAHFSTSSEGHESGDIVVLKGTPTSGKEAEDPEIPDGDILDGATEAYMPLWRIPIDGISVGDPESMFDVLLPMSELQSDMDTLRESLSRTRTLWEGSFGSGTIAVPGLSDYRLLIIEGRTRSMLCTVGANYVCGVMGLTTSTSGNVRLMGLSFTRSGDKLSYGDGFGVVDCRGVNHDVAIVATRDSVTRIIGLM